MPLRVMLAPAATRRRYSPLPFHMCACVCPQRKPRVRSSRLVQLLCRGVVVASTSSQHHWGLPCTVSAGTCLFPPDLNPNLDITHLAATAGIESCFLCTNAGFSVFAAVPFAKELKAAGTYTVGDFVGIAHRQFAEALLSRVHMVRCLNLDVDIPANLHAASGTPGGCDMMLHESPALRDLRVTFHVPVFVACGTLPSRDRRACTRVCHPASHVAIHASTTLAMRWPLPSLADDRPPHVCGLSPLRVVNDPTGHVPARLSPCHFRGSVVATMAPTGRILHPCR